MNAPFRHEAALVALREQIDTLEETVRQLREELAPVRSFPAAWRLTPQQATVLTCIMAASPGVATYRRILSALYEHKEPPDWADRLHSVIVFGIRKRLWAAGTDPGIQNIVGRGYWMTAETRERLLTTPDSGEATEPTWWAKARLLRAEGMSYRQIGRACGKGFNAVQRVMNGNVRASDIERKRRARLSAAQAREAL